VIINILVIIRLIQLFLDDEIAFFIGFPFLFMANYVVGAIISISNKKLAQYFHIMGFSISVIFAVFLVVGYLI